MTEEYQNNNANSINTSCKAIKHCGALKVKFVIALHDCTMSEGGITLFSTVIWQER